MARLIDDGEKQNMWGVQNGLEPQRSDLWSVDFANAVTGLQKAFGEDAVTPILPQMVQSVSLPEDKIKIEPYRRNSIAYQMPSWDEPLETLKMTFIMDMRDFDDSSNVLRFLQNWLELTRAGRGFRASSYGMNARGEAPLLLNENYQSKYRFDCFLSFLRGTNDSASTTSLGSDLEAWQTLRLQQMWIASLKISDLSYTTAATTTVEANFYVESIDWSYTP